MEKDGKRHPFIALEYVDGEPLKVYVERSASPLPEILGLVGRWPRPSRPRTSRASSTAT